MKNHTLLLVAATAVALGAMTAAIAQPAAPPAPKPMADFQAMDAADGAFAGGRGKFGEPTGEKMFTRVCAACHMADAKGATGAGTYPSLARNPKLAAGGYPAMVVVKGLNGMPPIGGMMTDKQVADVVNYVRTHFGNRYKDAVTPADVTALR